jgi:hypothetical protein
LSAPELLQTLQQGRFNFQKFFSANLRDSRYVRQSLIGERSTQLQNPW